MMRFDKQLVERYIVMIDGLIKMNLWQLQLMK